MKSFGAALTLWLLAAASAAAQFDSPSPPPVPSQSLPPPSLGLPEGVSGPDYESFPIGPVLPEIRTPTSYGAFYNQRNPETHSIDPAAFRRNRPALNTGCTTCGTEDAVCAPLGRIWGEFDYINWTARGDGVPALVTTSPTGTAAAAAGVLGANGTRTLSGNTGFSDDYRSGLRYNVGVWLNPGQTFGIQTGGFILVEGDTHNAFTSGGDPILARPFKNAVTGAASSQLIAFPGVVAGSVAIDHHNSANSFDVALRGNMCCAETWRLDALLGYRYLHLEDGLSINQNLVAGPTAPATLGVATGTSFTSSDRFHTTNTFNGLQVGVAGEQRFAQRWYASGTVKASLGWIDQMTDIVGVTNIVGPGLAPVQYPGGLLALSSNIGQTAHSKGVLIPEVNLGLGYQVSKYVRLRAGYSFLYIASVVRPGSILDTTVNPGLIPPPTGAATPARPAGTDRSDFILHGVNAGLEVRF